MTISRLVPSVARLYELRLSRREHAASIVSSASSCSVVHSCGGKAADPTYFVAANSSIEENGFVISLPLMSGTIPSEGSQPTRGGINGVEEPSVIFGSTRRRRAGEGCINEN